MKGNMIQRLSLKLGNMRRPQDFVVYPNRSQGAPETDLLIQSDKRIARIDLATGEGMLSSGKGGHPGFHTLSPVLGAMPIKVDAETLETLKAAQPKSGDKIGNGVYIA